MMVKAKKVEKTNNKNLLTIVLLIVAGIVILSYTNSTGFVTKSTRGVTTVEVSPTDVGSGDILLVGVKAGAKGYSNPLEIWKVDYADINDDGIYSESERRDNKVVDIKTAYCGPICTKDASGRSIIKYKVTTLKKGEYYVKTTDIGTGNKIKVYFDVV